MKRKSGIHGQPVSTGYVQSDTVALCESAAERSYGPRLPQATPSFTVVQVVVPGEEFRPREEARG